MGNIARWRAERSRVWLGHTPRELRELRGRVKLAGCDCASLAVVAGAYARGRRRARSLGVLAYSASGDGFALAGLARVSRVAGRVARVYAALYRAMLARDSWRVLRLLVLALRAESRLCSVLDGAIPGAGCGRARVLVSGVRVSAGRVAWLKVGLALAVGALCDALAVWRACGMRGGLVLGVCNG